MERTSQMIRRSALLAAVLLLWCHALGASPALHTAAASHAPLVGPTAVATLPGAPHAPALSCCFGGTGSNLLSVTLDAPPDVSAPQPGTRISPPPQSVPEPTRSRLQRLSPHRTSLLEQAVLLLV